jgi:hypothetical protein
MSTQREGDLCLPIACKSGDTTPLRRVISTVPVSYQCLPVGRAGRTDHLHAYASDFFAEVLLPWTKQVIGLVDNGPPFAKAGSRCFVTIARLHRFSSTRLRLLHSIHKRLGDCENLDRNLTFYS